MKTAQLTYLLQNPSEVKDRHMKVLEDLSKEFPYFQPVRALILKGLKNQNSFKYNQELKTTAAYTADRAILFEFITSPIFQSNIDSDPIKKEHDDIEVKDPEEIKVMARISMDDAISMHVQEAEEVLDPTLFSLKKHPKENIGFAEKIIEEATENKIRKVSEISKLEKSNSLEIDKPLPFNKKEKHSFVQWLQLTSLKPIDRPQNPTLEIDQKSNVDLKKTIPITKEKDSKKLPNFDLIESFIINNPKIQPVDKKGSSRNLALNNEVSPDELMTETLARVYLAQNKYKKAIQAYKILILKNPEKSGFFADQIKLIKKIQENK